MATGGTSGRVAFTARIPEELHKALRMACAESGADLQEAVTEALAAYLHGRAGAWPLDGATGQETLSAAQYVEALRASSSDVRWFLLDLVALVRKRAGLQ